MNRFEEVTLKVYHDTKNGFFYIRDAKNKVMVFVNPENLFETSSGEPKPLMRLPMFSAVAMQVMDTKVAALEEGIK